MGMDREVKISILLRLWESSNKEKKPRWIYKKKLKKEPMRINLLKTLMLNKLYNAKNIKKNFWTIRQKSKDYHIRWTASLPK